MEDLVPAPFGAHSTVGRATNRGMDKKRAIAVQLEDEAKVAAEARKEAAERIAAERAQTAKGKGAGRGGAKPRPATSPVAMSSPKSPQDKPKKKPMGEPMRSLSSGAAAGDQVDPLQSTPMGRAVREKLNVASPTAAALDQVASPTGILASPTAAEGTVQEQPTSPKLQRCTSAFTSLGMHDQTFSETARSHLGRFFVQGPSWPANLESGHYRPQETCVKKRVLGHEFGWREPHPVFRKEDTADKTRELGPEDLTVLEAHTTKQGSMHCQPSMFSTMTSFSGSLSGSLSDSQLSFKGQSLLHTHTKRGGLTEIPTRIGLSGQIQMSELSRSGDLVDQDKKTTKSHRSLETDLSNQLGRSGLPGIAGFEFFEVGKYKANHDVSKTTVKTGMGFHRQQSREAPSAHQTKSMPGSLNEGAAHHPDRSKYRHARVTSNKPRITHVMEMEKDLKRPNFFKDSECLHDASDPEVARLVHEYAMSTNADTLKRAVISRGDITLKMHHTLARDRAGHTSRIAQQDIAHRHKIGATGFETTGQIESSVEMLKDSNRRRPDLGLTFDQHKSRYQTRDKAAHSSLKKPRSHAAPDFARAAPFAGFSSRTPVKVMQRNRSHDAMPGWSAEAVDSLMADE